MLKFDHKTWNHYQENSQGVDGFVNEKTQEFLETMRKMAYLDHNSQTSNRYRKENKTVDRLMMDIALGSHTSASKTISMKSEKDASLD